MFTVSKEQYQIILDKARNKEILALSVKNMLRVSALVTNLNSEGVKCGLRKNFIFFEDYPLEECNLSYEYRKNTALEPRGKKYIEVFEKFIAASKSSKSAEHEFASENSARIFVRYWDLICKENKIESQIIKEGTKVKFPYLMRTIDKKYLKFLEERRADKKPFYINVSEDFSIRTVIVRKELVDCNMFRVLKQNKYLACFGSIETVSIKQITTKQKVVK